MDSDDDFVAPSIHARKSVPSKKRKSTSTPVIHHVAKQPSRASNEGSSSANKPTHHSNSHTTTKSTCRKLGLGQLSKHSTIKPRTSPQAPETHPAFEAVEHARQKQPCASCGAPCKVETPAHASLSAPSPCSLKGAEAAGICTVGPCHTKAPPGTTLDGERSHHSKLQEELRAPQLLPEQQVQPASTEVIHHPLPQQHLHGHQPCQHIQQPDNQRLDRVVQECQPHRSAPSDSHEHLPTPQELPHPDQAMPREEAVSAEGTAARDFQVLCPICQCKLAAISDTEVGRIAHVEACMAAMEGDQLTGDNQQQLEGANHQGGDIDAWRTATAAATGLAASTLADHTADDDWDQSHGILEELYDMEDGLCDVGLADPYGGEETGVEDEQQEGDGQADEGAGTGWEWGGEEEEPTGGHLGDPATTASSVPEWLGQLGLAQYMGLFQSAGVELDLLPLLTDADLQEMGITDTHHRQQLLQSMQDLAEGVPTDLPEDLPEDVAAAHLPDDMDHAAMLHQSSHVLQGLQDPTSYPPQPQPGMAGSSAVTPCHVSPAHAGGGAAGVGAAAAGDAVGGAGAAAAPTASAPGPSGRCPLAPIFSTRPVRLNRITDFLQKPASHHHQQHQQLQYQQQNQNPNQQPHQHPQPSHHHQAPAHPSNPSLHQSGAVQRGYGHNNKENQIIHGQAAREQVVPGPGGGGIGRPVPEGARQGQGTLPRWVPRCHTIPGTRFVVDMFGRSSHNIKTCHHWFLTHFHADHYKGLGKSFNQGVVVCSPVTAQLVSTKLKVPWAKLLVVHLDTPTVIDGVRITLIDANHCPGAVLIVAEPPHGPAVLHTGDCRLIPEMQQHPALQQLRGRAILVLDTTYCDPEYCFPPQQETLKYTLGAVAAEKFNPRALFVFGTYTIGKERLFLEVARSLGKKVYMSKEKLQTLQCCHLAPEYAQLLTNNHLETNIHAVPLFKVNIKGLAEILKHYKGRYNTIVGFQPTGWTMQQEQKTGHCGRRTQRGTIVLYQVPYSEHSSFRELHSFVSWFQAREVIPSVGNDNGPKLQRMLELLRQPLPPAAQPGKTIKQFFAAQPK